MRIAYLFSRYPIVSQTFCDTEMLALERLGVELELYSIYPPPTSFRHGHAARLEAPIHYAPPLPVLKLAEAAARKSGRWPAAFIAEQERKYGPAYKPDLRARNALYFADLFRARGITWFHVHFANRAAHTAVYLKKLSGIPFSMSTHGQDFMVDLGNNDLLREICQEAEFVANETEFSKNLVAGLCPESASKMVRVFNGMDLTNFPAPTAATCNPIPRIVSIGRLIEFKGFHHLISACAKLQWRGLKFTCDIIGEGPWRPQLQAQIDELGLGAQVRLTGSLPQEEVFTALRTCDIFALPCIVDQKGASDVFPTVILEAMASAKPVVSTRLAGVPEQIIDDRTGLLVEPGDEIALAEALAKLITSPDHRRMFGQSGRERLEKEFAIETTIQPLHELFKKHVPPATALPSRNWRTELDSETGELKAYATLRVVEKVEHQHQQISLGDAQKIKADAQLGEELEVCIPPRDCGYLAAKTAKPEIMRRIRQAKAENPSAACEDQVAGIISEMRHRFGNSAMPTGLAALLEEWPSRPGIEAELSGLCIAHPGTPIYVSQVAGAAPSVAAQQFLANCQFLPDGMVLEGEWQQERDLARRIETGRAELGQKLSSETFLQHARYALYLRQWLARDGIRHLHAAGALELLTAWILRRLCGITISVTIGEDLALPGSIVAQLSRDCAGVRFAAKNPDLTVQLQKNPGTAWVLHEKKRFGRGLDPEWFAKLAQWSATPPKP